MSDIESNTGSHAASMAVELSAPASRMGWVSSRCIRSAPSHLACERCTAGCPEQALVFALDDLDQPRLLATDQCHGCGACLPSCPTEAILGSELQQTELSISHAGNGAELSFSCHRVADHNGQQLHCLRTLAPDLIQHWQSRYPNKSITLNVAADCQQCKPAPTNTAQDQWWKSLSSLGFLVTQENEEATPDYRSAPGRSVSRRTLFSAQPFAPINVPETALYAEARRQKRHQRAREQLQQEALPLPQVQLDSDRCDASAVCATVCPVPALTLDDEGALYFSPLECIGCNACVEHCPSKALSINTEPGSPSRVLRKTPKARCFQCGHTFTDANTRGTDAAAQPVCPACRKEQALLRENFSQLFG